MSAINEKKHLEVSFSDLQVFDMDMDVNELQKTMGKILKKGIFGLSFSAYLEGQSPAMKSHLSKEQIRERLEIMSPYTKWVRSFSCTDGNQWIPEIAHEMGMKTMVGAWIDDNEDMNEVEIENLIQVAKDGHADIVAVGNEVLLRDELSEDRLISYIERVKKALPDVQVGYVDAYYIFAEYPRIVDAIDILLVNCYPFWECCAIEYSIDYMKQMYIAAKGASCGKPIIISETGWPSLGAANGGAVPSYEAAMQYFIGTYQWAKQDEIDIVYFSSFDEEWKIHAEGDVGAFWGIWDKNGRYKYGSL